MERAVRNNEQLESFKLESLKLESFAEVGKSQAELERTERSWKDSSEVGKNRAKLERTDRSWKVSFEVGEFRRSWKVSLQLVSHFPTSIGSFQLRSVLSNLKLSNFSFFPTALSNYTYPV